MGRGIYINGGISGERIGRRKTAKLQILRGRSINWNAEKNLSASSWKERCRGREGLGERMNGGIN